MRGVVILVLAAILVFARYSLNRPDYADGDRLRISARVSAEPVRYETAQYVKLKGIRMYLPVMPRIYYGDYLVVEGMYEEGKLTEVELIEVREGRSPLALIRKRIVAFYKKNLPEPHASLVAGVTLGSKAEIPESFFEALRTSGTLHVVVASGMNVTLVAGFVMGFLVNVINRKKAVILALVLVWIYVVVAGFEAPLIRAGIMGSIAFGAQALGRVNTAWRAFFVSAFVMLMIWPSWLTDLGFLLSFTATGSLMLFEPVVNRVILSINTYRKKTWLPHGVKEGLTTSTAAQIGVAPIIYFTFGQFNILSPVINALVLWTIPYITIIGMTAGIVGIVVEPLGRIIIYMAYPLSFMFVKVVELFS